MKKIFNAIKITAAILTVTTVLSACSFKGSIKEGAWDGDTFTNEWSGITFDLPAGFRVATPEEIKAVNETGAEIMVNEGVDETALDLTELKMFYDFMLVYEDDATSITLMYENLAFSPTTAGVSADEYYEIIKEDALEMTAMDFKVVSKSNLTLAGEDYIKGSFSAYGGLIYQDYYLRKHDGAIIGFIITYLDDTKSAVDSFISSIKKAE